jgi:hypothetical protein
MANIDVCNGDADGLCALVQLRLAEPAAAALVTGLKRDIALLDGVHAGAGDLVTVLDVSLERNRAPLERLLADGAAVRYFDHHVPGAVPSHPNLVTYIDASADVCTSLLVDHYLNGRFRRWALVGAFGDNLRAAAERTARPLALGDAQLAALRSLGEAINYNAYGERDSDVLVHPAELYPVLVKYRDPFELIAAEPVVAELQSRRAADLARAQALTPYLADARGAIYMLPDEGWSRRVIGTFAHWLAAREPARAFAVLRPNERGGYTVSVRAPLDAPAGADALCRAFGGGGRRGAAGIDDLPLARFDEFIARCAAVSWGAV